MWSSGDVIAVREVWNGRVWKARPWIVVHDRPDQLALFTPAGATTKIPAGPSAVHRDDWTLVDGSFGDDALRLTDPGEPHSVMLFWRAGRFEAWYVNLERPLRCSSAGFDYLDQQLDVLVRPDRRWELLDEDEFQEGQRAGVISAAEAAAVRAEADRMIERIEAWTPPFSDGWENWRPDPAWPMPTLPPGWDRVA